MHLGRWQRGGKAVTSMLGTDMSAEPGLVPALMELVIWWESRVHGVLERRGSGAVTATAGERDPVEEEEEELAMHRGPRGQGTCLSLRLSSRGTFPRKLRWPLCSGTCFLLRHPRFLSLGTWRVVLTSVSTSFYRWAFQGYGPDPFASVPLPQPQLLDAGKESMSLCRHGPMTDGGGGSRHICHHLCLR